MTFDNTQARTEGWSLFEGYGDPAPWRLEKDDEATVFEGDGDAWLFVSTRAKEGSQYHLAALGFLAFKSRHEYQDIQEYVAKVAATK